MILFFRLSHTSQRRYCDEHWSVSTDWMKSVTWSARSEAKLAGTIDATLQMVTRFLRICTLGGVLYAVVGGSTFSRAGLPGGYLPSTGPVPLRFAPEKAALTGYELPPLAMDDRALTRGILAASAENIAAETSDNLAALNQLGPVAPDPANQAGFAGFDSDPLAITQPPMALSAPTLPGSATNAAASDVLVVTPQMLVEYFKADRAKTNTVNAVNVVNPAVYVPVGFTPPAPTAFAAPSSSATYRSQ